MDRVPEQRPPVNRSEPIDIDRLFDEGTAIDEAIGSAVLQDLSMHKLLGNPVAEWRDGKVVLIPPEEIQIDEDMTD